MQCAIIEKILIKLNELFKLILLIILLLFLIIYYYNAQNCRYVQYRWGESSRSLILDTRTGALYNVFPVQGKPGGKFWSEVVPPLNN